MKARALLPTGVLIAVPIASSTRRHRAWSEPVFVTLVAGTHSPYWGSL